MTFCNSQNLTISWSVFSTQINSSNKGLPEWNSFCWTILKVVDWHANPRLGSKSFKSDKHCSLSVKIVNYRKESRKSFDTFWVGFNWKKKSDNHNELDKSSDCFRKRKKIILFHRKCGRLLFHQPVISSTRLFINFCFHRLVVSSTCVFID